MQPGATLVVSGVSPSPYKQVAIVSLSESEMEVSLVSEDVSSSSSRIEEVGMIGEVDAMNGMTDGIVGKVGEDFRGKVAGLGGIADLVWWSRTC